MSIVRETPKVAKVLGELMRGIPFRRLDDTETIYVRPMPCDAIREVERGCVYVIVLADGDNCVTPGTGYWFDETLPIQELRLCEQPTYEVAGS